MAAKKKKPAAKRAAVKKKPAPVLDTIFYRGCSGVPPALYMVEATELVNAPSGGLDLTDVPPGRVSLWDGKAWATATLPPVGHDPHCVRHTKNVARIGV